MRRGVFIIALILLLLTGCTVSESAEPASDNHNARILFATDLHYLSPKLYDNNGFFRDFIDGGDGKLTYYSEEIMDAFIQEVLNDRPDALILGGDLTFNGELESHKGLAEKLAAVSGEGIPVLVIPGNHDINRPNTYSYKDNSFTRVDSISPKGFWDSYSVLGADKALSFDKYSLSYVYELSQNVRVLMLDTSLYQEGKTSSKGYVQDETLLWVKQCLSNAEQAGDTVISVTHQSILEHHSMFPNYTIINNQQLVDLFEEYGVRFNLSGHIHIQSLVDDDGKLFDVATNSLSVYKNKYANVSIGDKLVYETRSVDVQKWAESVSSADVNLLNFQEYSLERFDNVTISKIRNRLEENGITGEQQDVMAEFAARVNRHFFVGNLYNVLEELENDPAYELWKTVYPQDFFTGYISAVLSGNTRECNYLEIDM